MISLISFRFYTQDNKIWTFSISNIAPKQQQETKRADEDRVDDDATCERRCAELPYHNKSKTKHRARRMTWREAIPYARLSYHVVLYQP